jgi:hypothetical protein
VPSGLVNRSIGKVAERVPGVRRIPVVQLLVAADVAMRAADHIQRLSPEERRRFVHLVRVGRGRSNRLTDPEAAELQAIVEKLQPRRLMGDAVNSVSPVPLPKRLLYGKRA